MTKAKVCAADEGKSGGAVPMEIRVDGRSLGVTRMAGSNGTSRWVKVVIWTVLMVAVAFYTAGGFVFASMIHSDLLTPQPPTPDYGVYVAANR